MKNFYLSLALQCAAMSRAVRLKVGCVIVKDDNVISFSWNGTPTGWDNECENIEFVAEAGQDYEEMTARGYVFGCDADLAGYVRRVTKPEVIHAESNAISKLARSASSGSGADLFVTHSPCMDCAKLIYQAGIRRVFWRENYRDDSGLKFLQKSGVEVQQIQ